MPRQQDIRSQKEDFRRSSSQKAARLWSSFQPPTSTMSSPSSFLGGLQIYIFPAKIEASELNKLELTVPLHGGQIVHSPGEADLVLSRAKRKARMALSLPEEIFVSLKTLRLS